MGCKSSKAAEPPRPEIRSVESQLWKEDNLFTRKPEPGTTEKDAEPLQQSRELPQAAGQEKAIDSTMGKSPEPVIVSEPVMKQDEPEMQSTEVPMKTKEPAVNEPKNKEKPAANVEEPKPEDTTPKPEEKQPMQEELKKKQEEVPPMTPAEAGALSPTPAVTEPESKPQEEAPALIPVGVPLAAEKDLAAEKEEEEETMPKSEEKDAALAPEPVPETMAKAEELPQAVVSFPEKKERPYEPALYPWVLDFVQGKIAEQRPVKDKAPVSVLVEEKKPEIEETDEAKNEETGKEHKEKKVEGGAGQEEAPQSDAVEGVPAMKGDQTDELKEVEDTTDDVFASALEEPPLDMSKEEEMENMTEDVFVSAVQPQETEKKEAPIENESSKDNKEAPATPESPVVAPDPRKTFSNKSKLERASIQQLRARGDVTRNLQMFDKDAATKSHIPREVTKESNIQSNIDMFGGDKQLTEVQKRRLELEKKEKEARDAADPKKQLKTTWGTAGRPGAYKKKVVHKQGPRSKKNLADLP